MVRARAAAPADSSKQGSSAAVQTHVGCLELFLGLKLSLVLLAVYIDITMYSKFELFRSNYCIESLIIWRVHHGSSIFSVESVEA